ncbi:MAG: hypothetical protein CL920_11285 [Deltaproteobacteria bacterium]|nr:hypothetical protein [Deltaproteobacteria bacterium]
MTNTSGPRQHLLLPFGSIQPLGALQRGLDVCKVWAKNEICGPCGIQLFSQKSPLRRSSYRSLGTLMLCASSHLLTGEVK